MTHKELIERLEDDIKYAGDDMNHSSWGMEEGVLLSGNEAKLFIELLKKNS